MYRLEYLQRHRWTEIKKGGQRQERQKGEQKVFTKK